MDMDLLCEDIVTEILVRLADCKTAIRLGTVCKRWSSVINSPDFKQRFNENKKKNKECMEFMQVFRMDYFHANVPTYDLSISGGGEKCLEFLPWNKDMSLLASGGGLLASLVDSSDKKELCISNPLTKQWSLLPQGATGFLTGLACNPDNTHFKFVFITSIRNEQLTSKVFCSELGAWTLSSMPLSFLGSTTAHYFYSECTQIGTTLYWLMMEARGPRVVLAHDPFERWSRFIEVPHENDNINVHIQRRWRMGNVLGRLRLSRNQWKKKKAGGFHSLKIWELKDDKHCWSLVHRVKPTSFYLHTAFVVGFHPNDSNKMFVTTDRSDVCLYDISGETFQKLGQFNPYLGIGLFQDFSLLHPSSMPCPVPKFVDHC